jgi:hypothetical protein
MSGMLTVQTRKTDATSVKQASALLATYRESGQGSNRTNWKRTATLLAAVLTVIAEGDAVEITGLFPATGAGKQYHIAHRALSSGMLRPNWGDVTVVVLKNAVTKGKMVTGETTTTGSGRVFIVQAE